MYDLELNNNVFESIKYIDELGYEYWYARELMPLLEYSKWQNFHKVINIAKEACKLSNNNECEQFTEVSKLITGGKGNKQKPLIINYHAMPVTSLSKIVILEKKPLLLDKHILPFKLGAKN